MSLALACVVGVCCFRNLHDGRSFRERRLLLVQVRKAPPRFFLGPSVRSSIVPVPGKRKGDGPQRLAGGGGEDDGGEENRVAVTWLPACRVRRALCDARSHA